MSVDFYVYRPDVPDDLATRVATDYAERFSGYDPLACVRLNVPFLYDDALEERWPALYPDYYENEDGTPKLVKDLRDGLNTAIQDTRRQQLLFVKREYWPAEYQGRRWRSQLSGMRELLTVMDEHPDWKILTQS